MADDRSNMMKSNESQDEPGQAQARRLDESVMMGKVCEPQDSMQRGMDHEDTNMKDLLGNVVSPGNDSMKKSGSVGGDGGSGNNSNTYMYSNHSLI